MRMRSSRYKPHGVAERILAVGYYGWGNFGDELFREVVRAHASKIWGRSVVVRDFVFPILRWRRKANPIGVSIRALEALIGGIWADRIAFFGGSVFSQVSGTAALRQRLFRRRRTFEALGVSIGPFADFKSKESVHQFLSMMARIVVRDAASVGRSPIDVELGGDLAALHDMPRVSESQRSGLTICPSAASGVSPQTFVKLLLSLLPESTEQRITLLALNSGTVGSDAVLCDQICHGLQLQGFEVDVVQFENVQQVIEIISTSQAVWSQRLHGVITAYLCGVPVLAFSHHSKLADFAADIELEDSSVLTSMEANYGNVSAARRTLDGIPSWGVPPEHYIRSTRRGFGLVQ